MKLREVSKLILKTKKLFKICLSISFKYPRSVKRKATPTRSRAVFYTNTTIDLVPFRVITLVPCWQADESNRRGNISAARSSE